MYAVKTLYSRSYLYEIAIQARISAIAQKPRDAFHYMEVSISITTLFYYTHMYSVSQKSRHHTLVHIFIKYRPSLKILVLAVYLQ